MDWQTLLAYISGTVDQGLLLRNAYLVTENRILRNQITGRIRLSDGERKTLLRAVKLLGDEGTMPAEDGVGFDEGGHSLWGLVAQLLADLGQRFALATTQPDTPRDLVAQDAVLRHQVRVA